MAAILFAIEPAGPDPIVSIFTLGARTCRVPRMSSAGRACPGRCRRGTHRGRHSMSRPPRPPWTAVWTPVSQTRMILFSHGMTRNSRRFDGQVVQVRAFMPDMLWLLQIVNHPPHRGLIGPVPPPRIESRRGSGTSLRRFRSWTDIHMPNYDILCRLQSIPS
jgi:hypothetical protein